MLLAYCLGAFFLGSIPTAYWAGRLCKGTDIRQHGSGNVGATNAYRVLGKKIGTAVFLIDFLKGAAPVLLYRHFSAAEPGSELAYLAVGMSAVLGHVFSPFLGFKGGKGVATGAGMLTAAMPIVFLCALAVWLLVFLLSRIVSLASLAAAAALFLSGLAATDNPVSKASLFFIALFVFWTHRTNIKKLLKGEEKSIS